MLDEFVITTGYSRKYANKLLKNGVSRKPRQKAGRKKKYQGEVIEVALPRKVRFSFEALRQKDLARGLFDQRSKRLVKF